MGKINKINGVVISIHNAPDYGLNYQGTLLIDLLLLPDPFQGMGAWQETMEPQNPGNCPGPRAEGVQRRSCKKPITGQYRMRRRVSWVG